MVKSQIKDQYIELVNSYITGKSVLFLGEKDYFKHKKGRVDTLFCHG